MYQNLTLMQAQMTKSQQADNLRRKGAQAFWKMRAAGLVRRWWARLTGRDTQSADLNQVAAQASVTNRQDIGRQEVALQDILGSEGRSGDFDAGFHPVTTHIRDRWVGIYVARQQGVVLPPVSLVKVGEGYFIRDGNHRVSVASFLGQNHIDAEVIVWETT
jgi:hypothetical protein